MAKTDPTNRSEQQGNCEFCRWRGAGMVVLAWLTTVVATEFIAAEFVPPTEAEQVAKAEESEAVSSIVSTPGEQVENELQLADVAEGDPTSVPYLLYTPEEANDPGETKWPLVLFLHGLGESGNGGDELQKVAIHGPPKQAKTQDFPFYIASPQCPMPERGKYRPAWRAERLLALLEELSAELPIDKSRVYLTGLSMGGFGSWRLAATAPERFAAVAPVCGGGDPSTAAALINTPLWVFHGADDNVVPLKMSQVMVDAVKAAGGDPKFTIYPGVGHGSWNNAYSEPEFYNWLLSHSLED